MALRPGPESMADDMSSAMRAFREGGDDHFYGAWHGGSKASGGGPGKAPAETSGMKASRSALDRVTPMGPFNRASYNPREVPTRDPAGQTALWEARAQAYLDEHSGDITRAGGPNECAIVRYGRGGAGLTAVYFDADERPVASVSMEPSWRDGKTMSIQMVDVSPQHRGKGVGTAMYDWLHDNGIVNLYDSVGLSDSFTLQGKMFAQRWLEHRVKVERERAGIREATTDDHFYGAWSGGKKSEGGGPVGGAKTDRGLVVGKQWDDHPEISVKVVERPQGHGAVASYSDQRGEIQLSKGSMQALDEHGARALYWVAVDKDGKSTQVDGTVLPQGTVKGVGGQSYELRHEVGHGFETQFDLTDTKVTAGLGRYDREALLYGKPGGGFVGYGLGYNGKPPALTTWKNPSEAAADAFAHYVQAPEWMHPTTRSWVEARLAERPGWDAIVTRLREHPDPRHWVERGSIREATSEDQHFYGSWRGGSTAQGGGPGRAPTLDERRRDMALRVGAENVGVPPRARAARAALRGRENAKPIGVPEPIGRMTEEEALKRIVAAMPNTRVEGLQWMHPKIRGEVVPMLESLAVAFPGHHPSLLSVGGANSGNHLTRTAFRAGAMGVTTGGVQVALNRAYFDDPARFQKVFDKSERDGWFAQGTGMTPAQYVVTHEWGHQVNRGMNVAHRPDMLTPNSLYARNEYAERWAEAFTSWTANGVSDQPTRYVGDILARRWPERYGHLRDEGMLPSRLAEATAEDDHYYGAWHGGSKASGGHPVGKAPAGAGAAPGATTVASEAARRERMATEPLSAVKAEAMNTHEASVRLAQTFPGVALEGIERLSPEARAEVVPMFEALAAKYPDVKPSGIVVKPRVMGSAGATTSRTGVITLHDEFINGSLPEWVARNEKSGWLVGTGGGNITPHGAIVVHEWGHLLANRRTGTSTGLTAFVPRHTSMYGRRTPAEKWAEAFAAFHVGKHPTPARVETALGHKGDPKKSLSQERAAARKALRERPWLRQSNGTWVREATTDDHFYGAWHGGSKASGGGPGKAPAKVPAQDEGDAARAARAAIARSAPQDAKHSWKPDQFDYNGIMYRRLQAANMPESGDPNTTVTNGVRGSNRLRDIVHYGADGRAVALAQIEHSGDPHEKIAAVLVNPSLKGKGIGSRLYDDLQDGKVVQFVPGEGMKALRFDLYALVGKGQEFTPAGKAFAIKWLEHRVALERQRAGIREASVSDAVQDAMESWRETSSDDHFYGAWKGGTAASGGHPAGKASHAASAPEGFRIPAVGARQSAREAIIEKHRTDATANIKADAPKVPKPEGPMSAEEATRRLEAAIPGVRLHNIERMDPVVRGELVPTFEMLSRSFPESRPKSIHVGQPHDDPVTLASPPSAMAATVMADMSLHLHASRFGSDGADLTREIVRENERVGWLVGTYGGAMTPHQSLLVHEWGHLVDKGQFSRIGALRIGNVSPTAYGHIEPPEGFAESFVHHVAGARTSQSAAMRNAIAKDRQERFDRWGNTS